MVFLIGVDHMIQYENTLVPPELFSKFREFITSVARENEVDLIAEEFNEEYLGKVYFSPRGTLQSLAVELGLDHLFCDPGDARRQWLGIPCYADLKDSVKLKYGVNGTFVFDDELRRKIDEDTRREVLRYWDIREEFWLEMLSPHFGRNIIFVCGHEHVERFRDLLERRGQSAIVLEAFWGREFFLSFS